VTNPPASSASIATSNAISSRKPLGLRARSIERPPRTPARPVASCRATIATSTTKKNQAIRPR
jgi:hypothetical protein